MKNKVIVITLNYNQNNYTLKCVDSILESNYKNFILLLIDNGSEFEHYTELLEALPEDDRIIIHRLEQNRGYVGGINYGLEEGAKLKLEYFLIMNNDTILDKNAISELTKTCIQYNDKAIVTGKVYHYEEPDKLQDIGYAYKNKKRLLYNRIALYEKDKGQYDKEAERDMIDDVFWLIPNKLFHEIGGYSPYFWFNAEQADFALRAKNAGYKLIYTPEAKIWHKGGASIGGRNYNPKLAYWHIQSTLIFRFRHLSKLQFSLQYIEIFLGILSTYLRTLIKIVNKRNAKFDYANAKLGGLLYFNKWLFIKNENKGINPF